MAELAVICPAPCRKLPDVHQRPTRTLQSAALPSYFESCEAKQSWHRLLAILGNSPVRRQRCSACCCSFHHRRMSASCAEALALWKFRNDMHRRISYSRTRHLALPTRTDHEFAAPALHRCMGLVWKDPSWEYANGTVSWTQDSLTADQASAPSLGLLEAPARQTCKPDFESRRSCEVSHYKVFLAEAGSLMQALSCEKASCLQEIPSYDLDVFCQPLPNF